MIVSPLWKRTNCSETPATKPNQTNNRLTRRERAKQSKNRKGTYVSSLLITILSTTNPAYVRVYVADILLPWWWWWKSKDDDRCSAPHWHLLCLLICITEWHMWMDEGCGGNNICTLILMKPSVYLCYTFVIPLYCCLSSVAGLVGASLYVRLSSNSLRRR